MTTIDTRLVYDPLPYNIQDKNPSNNRQGMNPSYQYKKKRIIWLNTAYATSSISSGTTYYEFSFDIPAFQLYNQTTLKVVNYCTNDNTSKPMIIKLKNLNYDTNSTYNTDKEGYPTILTAHTGATGMLFDTEYTLTLTPQLINNITISVNGSFTARNSGITISGGGNGHFILGLLFETAELELDNIVSIYK